MKYINIIIFLVAVLCFMAILKENFRIHNKNILGKTLSPCSTPGQKTTGYYRDGYCSTGTTDTGTHVVCARMDDNFLNFTKSKGNDLMTSRDSFPGLVAGDKWCVCALRWKEAHEAGKAPRIFPESTSDAVLKYVPKNVLTNYAV